MSSISCSCSGFLFDLQVVSPTLVVSISAYVKSCIRHCVKVKLVTVNITRKQRHVQLELKSVRGLTTWASVALGAFLCIRTPNTGQLNSLFHTFCRILTNQWPSALQPYLLLVGGQCIIFSLCFLIAIQFNATS